MKLKKIWKNTRNGLSRGPIGALGGAILAGLGFEIGAGIYRALTGKRRVERKREAAPEEER